MFIKFPSYHFLFTVLTSFYFDIFLLFIVQLLFFLKENVDVRTYLVLAVLFRENIIPISPVQKFVVLVIFTFLGKLWLAGGGLLLSLVCCISKKFPSFSFIFFLSFFVLSKILFNFHFLSLFSISCIFIKSLQFLPLLHLL